VRQEIGLAQVYDLLARARYHRFRAQLLRCARRRPPHLASRPRPLQGLHRHCAPRIFISRCIAPFSTAASPSRCKSARRKCIASRKKAWPPHWKYKSGKPASEDDDQRIHLDAPAHRMVAGTGRNPENFLSTPESGSRRRSKSTRSRPKGRVLELPPRRHNPLISPIWFTPKVGHQCVGAKVNGQMVFAAS